MRQLVASLVRTCVAGKRTALSAAGPLLFSTRRQELIYRRKKKLKKKFYSVFKIKIKLKLLCLMSLSNVTNSSPIDGQIDIHNISHLHVLLLGYGFIFLVWMFWVFLSPFVSEKLEETITLVKPTGALQVISAEEIVSGTPPLMKQAGALQVMSAEEIVSDTPPHATENDLSLCEIHHEVYLPTTEKEVRYQYEGFCFLCNEQQDMKPCCQNNICSTCITLCIEAGPPGARLTFNHLYCPFRCGSLIGSDIDDANFQIKRQEQLDLMKTVHNRAVSQLQVDNAITEGMSEEDIVVLAMNTYSYVKCARCKDVMFGGLLQCEAAAGGAPQCEILCLTCNGVGKNTCEIHGPEEIEWKCMFCCKKRPVTFLCGGVDNYCDECHKYPGQCTPCDPEDCIFNGNHPSEAGESGKKCPRFSLGCALCKTLSNSSRIYNRSTDSEGNIYEGEFLGREKHGKGVFKMINGNVYHGEFSRDVKQGLGTLDYKNGARYSGLFIKDNLGGRGVYTYPNGTDSYVGEFFEGKFHGHGTRSYSNRFSYTGTFKNGEIDRSVRGIFADIKSGLSTEINLVQLEQKYQTAHAKYQFCLVCDSIQCKLTFSGNYFCSQCNGASKSLLCTCQHIRSCLSIEETTITSIR